jgi:diguanylate cyclase (GGDEF)-like protein
LVVPNAQADERFARNPAVTNPPHIRSYLGVPLETPDGYNIGALCAIDLVPREFTSREIEMLKSFASIVVDELELRDLARLDHLTGALSRRTFLEEAGQAIRRLKRYDRPASIVMFDIDHFKLINDKYGHPAGDAVLRAVGGACSSLARDGDSFGRLGGEEFAFLLPDTATGGFAAAERFRKMLSTLATASYPSIRITASFGIASLTPDMTVERWIVAADTALYAAKHGGRNQSRLAV